MSEQQQWFATLQEALESEGLKEQYPSEYPTEMDSGFEYTWTYDDPSTDYGVQVMMYRDENGLYKRPKKITR